MQVVFFSVATTVISEVAVAFCISMQKLTHVKIFWKKRHTKMFSINCIKRQVSICDGVLVCLSLCGRIYLWTQLNPETSVPVQHWTHEAISDNMRWSSSLHFSVWRWIPVNRTQLKNNQKCWAINPWSDVWQYVVVFSLHLSVWMSIPVNQPQWRNNWNTCALKPSSDVCQYVVLRLFVFQCVDTHTCSLNAKKKQS